MFIQDLLTGCSTTSSISTVNSMNSSDAAELYNKSEKEFILNDDLNIDSMKEKELSGFSRDNLFQDFFNNEEVYFDLLDDNKCERYDEISGILKPDTAYSFNEFVEMCSKIFSANMGKTVICDDIKYADIVWLRKQDLPKKVLGRLMKYYLKVLTNI